MWVFLNHVDKTKGDTQEFEHGDAKEIWKERIKRNEATKNKDPDSLPDFIDAIKIRNKLFH